MSEEKDDIDFCFSREQAITQENALLVIAHELRDIKRTLHAAVFAPNCTTVLRGIEEHLYDLAYVEKNSVPAILKRIAKAIETFPVGGG